MIFHIPRTVSGQEWHLGADEGCSMAHFQITGTTNSAHWDHFLARVKHNNNSKQ